MSEAPDVLLRIGEKSGNEIVSRERDSISERSAMMTRCAGQSSLANLAASSGPMPAGSPAVMAMMGSR